MRELSEEEERELERIRRLYAPARLMALDVVPRPTVVEHIWFLLAVIDLYEIAVYGRTVAGDGVSGERGAAGGHPGARAAD